MRTMIILYCADKLKTLTLMLPSSFPYLFSDKDLGSMFSFICDTEQVSLIPLLLSSVQLIKYLLYIYHKVVNLTTHSEKSLPAKGAEELKESDMFNKNISWGHLPGKNQT